MTGPLASASTYPYPITKNPSQDETSVALNYRCANVGLLVVFNVPEIQIVLFINVFIGLIFEPEGLMNEEIWMQITTKWID